MTAKIIFNWLIWVFGGACIVGLLVGLYSVREQHHFEAFEITIGKIAIWLFFGGGIVAMICIIIRITLGIR